MIAASIDLLPATEGDVGRHIGRAARLAAALPRGADCCDRAIL
jgi:hypothetical protein